MARMVKHSSASSWQKWPKAVGRLLHSARAHLTDRGPLSPEMVATALYRGLLGRDPDPGGLLGKVGQLRSGPVLEHVIRAFVESPEFRSRMLEAAVPAVVLPDLTLAMPEMYRREADTTVYVAAQDADIGRMVRLIDRHRYYDAFGVWSPIIDLDKEITAAIVRGLG